MSTHTMPRRKSQTGFSLIELMVVVAILTLIMGAVFRQIITVQQRYRAEEAKLDLTQESREFLDQIVRDLHQAGYPTVRMYNTGIGGAALATPVLNDFRVAAGLVKYSYNDLWFEGDLDGSGTVQVVEYSVNAPGGTCPCSIQRRQTPKLNNTAPLNQTGSSGITELQNVVNSAGSGGPGTNGAYSISGTGPGGVSNNVLYGGLASAYIFRAYDASGNLVTPTDITSLSNPIGNIRSIKISINVLAAPTASDLQTQRRVPVAVTATARMTNPAPPLP